MMPPRETVRRPGSRLPMGAGVLAAALLLLPGGGGALRAAERPLTLDEAIERALRHN